MGCVRLNPQADLTVRLRLPVNFGQNILRAGPYAPVLAAAFHVADRHCGWTKGKRGNHPTGQVVKVYVPVCLTTRFKEFAADCFCQ